MATRMSCGEGVSSGIVRCLGDIQVPQNDGTTCWCGKNGLPRTSCVLRRELNYYVGVDIHVSKMYPYSAVENGRNQSIR
jgi:hypothetical protein